MPDVEPLTHAQILEALANLGYDHGWVVSGDAITLWELDTPQPTEAEMRAAL